VSEKTTLVENSFIEDVKKIENRVVECAIPSLGKGR
jgi:hypothetical protein